MTACRLRNIFSNNCSSILGDALVDDEEGCERFTASPSISISRCKKRAYTAAALMLAEQSEEQYRNCHGLASKPRRSAQRGAASSWASAKRKRLR
jgi:hypothetical protein